MQISNFWIFELPMLTQDQNPQNHSPPQPKPTPTRPFRVQTHHTRIKIASFLIMNPTHLGKVGEEGKEQICTLQFNIQFLFTLLGGRIQDKNSDKIVEEYGKMTHVLKINEKDENRYSR